jgi:hypothetical protein
VQELDSMRQKLESQMGKTLKVVETLAKEK